MYHLYHGLVGIRSFYPRGLRPLGRSAPWGIRFGRPMSPEDPTGPEGVLRSVPTKGPRVPATQWPLLTQWPPSGRPGRSPGSSTGPGGRWGSVGAAHCPSNAAGRLAWRWGQGEGHRVTCYEGAGCRARTCAVHASGACCSLVPVHCAVYSFSANTLTRTLHPSSLVGVEPYPHMHATHGARSRPDRC